jgi:hypothetical protein
LPRQCSSRNLDPIRRPSSSDRLASAPHTDVDENAAPAGIANLPSAYPNHRIGLP